MSSGCMCVTFFEHRKSPKLSAYHTMLTMLRVISKTKPVLEMTSIWTINPTALSALSVFDGFFVACFMLGKTAGCNNDSLVEASPACFKTEFHDLFLHGVLSTVTQTDQDVMGYRTSGLNPMCAR
jgi:hypothetical protein